MKLSLNINEKASVTLTEYGEQILKDVGLVYYDHNFDQRTKTLTTQLWVIIQIFGDKMYMGNQQIFKYNLITIESGLL